MTKKRNYAESTKGSQLQNYKNQYLTNKYNTKKRKPEQDINKKKKLQVYFLCMPYIFNKFNIVGVPK